MCGIAGAFGVENASYVVSLMLKVMQHRGREAAGIVSSSGGKLHEHKGFGLVDEVFGDVDFAKRLPGTAAIGHIRYATTGATDDSRNIQPLVVRWQRNEKAIVHNGNLTNYATMRSALEAKGAIFQSSSDTELFLHLMAQPSYRKDDAVARLCEACDRVEGAYSILMLTTDSLVAAADPLEFRPLSAAKFGDGWLFASETCAFDLFGGAAGPHFPIKEPMEIGLGWLSPHRLTVPHGKTTRHCSFEHIYFTKPDSTIFGVSAGSVRKKLGAALAAEAPTATDIVIAVPDSSNTMAAAYARALGIPFEFGLVKNHYAGRTFITPKQTAREHGVRMKFNADRDVVGGKTVTVVDDSLVRGTTAKKIVELLRSAGAKEVHLRIASPPVIHPCHWGIDTPSRKELIAADTQAIELARILGADSLSYLSLDALRTALGDTEGAKYCTTCFTSILPTDGLIPPEALLSKR